jgi:hypothetical protein
MPWNLFYGTFRKCHTIFLPALFEKCHEIFLLAFLKMPLNLFGGTFQDAIKKIDYTFQ